MWPVTPARNKRKLKKDGARTLFLKHEIFSEKKRESGYNWL